MVAWACEADGSVYVAIMSLLDHQIEIDIVLMTCTVCLLAVVIIVLEEEEEEEEAPGANKKTAAKGCR